MRSNCSKTCKFILFFTPLKLAWFLFQSPCSLLKIWIDFCLALTGLMFTVRGLSRKQPRVLVFDACFHVASSAAVIVLALSDTFACVAARKGQKRPSYSVKNPIFSLVFFFLLWFLSSNTRLSFLLPWFIVSFGPPQHKNWNRENGQIESRRSFSCFNLVDVLGGLLRDAPLGRDRHLYGFLTVIWRFTSAMAGFCIAC